MEYLLLAVSGILAFFFGLLVNAAIRLPGGEFFVPLMIWPLLLLLFFLQKGVKQAILGFAVGAITALIISITVPVLPWAESLRAFGLAFFLPYLIFIVLLTLAILGFVIKGESKEVFRAAAVSYTQALSGARRSDQMCQRQEIV